MEKQMGRIIGRTTFIDDLGYKWTWRMRADGFMRVRLVGDRTKDGGYFADTFSEAVAELIRGGYIDPTSQFMQEFERVRRE